MIDLGTLREKLAAGGGRDLWRSFDELAQTDEFLALLHHEFPRQMRGLVEGVDRGGSSSSWARRRWRSPASTPARPAGGDHRLREAARGWSSAGAALRDRHSAERLRDGCPGREPRGLADQDRGQYAHPPASAAAIHRRRPIPRCTIRRARRRHQRRRDRPWSALVDALEQRSAPSDRVAAPVSGCSPRGPRRRSPADRGFLDAYPRRAGTSGEAFGRDDVRAGACARSASRSRPATICSRPTSSSPRRRPVRHRPEPSPLRPRVRLRRRPDDMQRPMNRLWSSSPCRRPRVRRPIIASRCAPAPRLRRGVAAGGRALCAGDAAAVAPHGIDAMATSPGTAASVVIAGEQQPPAVHALAHAINAALDNVGRTVFHTDAVEAAGRPGRRCAIRADMDAGACSCSSSRRPVFTRRPTSISSRSSTRSAAHPRGARRRNRRALPLAFRWPIRSSRGRTPRRRRRDDRQPLIALS